MEKTTFYLIRHGESKSNAAYAVGTKIVSKDFWGSDLSDLGVEQAKKLASKLSSVHFDAAFSSDLLRAKRTAEILSLEHELLVITNDTIRESNAHSFHHFDPEKQKEMKEVIANLTQEEKVSYKGGDDMETYDEAATRLLLFIRELSVAYAGKTVLIVAHGTLMRSFLIKLGFATYDQLPSGSIENTGYAIIESDGVEFSIIETVGIKKRL